ncbi:MAG TPA: hypothetical protein VD902_00910, partial [Symbiobacteriaceae bacterium]|nr:hypothetical protein [Symbiobacteriaceae bacterium]
SPGAAVAMVLEACHEGDWLDVVGIFRGGTDAFQKWPDQMQRFLYEISGGERAVTYRTHGAKFERGGLVLWFTTYADEAREEPISTMTWRFARAESGWFITEVV